MNHLNYDIRRKNSGVFVISEMRHNGVLINSLLVFSTLNCAIYIFLVCVKLLKSGGVFRYSYHPGSHLCEYSFIGCLSWSSIKNVVLVVLTGKSLILYPHSEWIII